MNIETAKRLFEYRKANGFSQEELAEKIGVSRQAISKWERSESSPDTDNLIALANLYGITIDELLNGTDAPKKISEDQPKEEPDKESPKTRNFPMMKKKAQMLILPMDLPKKTGKIRFISDGTEFMLKAKTVIMFM